MPTRTVRGVSIVVGFLVFLMGLYVIGKRVPRYHAEATVAITPAARADTGAALEGLVGGEVVRTFAEAFSGSVLITPALDELKVEIPDRETISVTSEAVEDSAVIRIEATALTRELAEGVASAVASGTPRIAGLRQVYEPHLVRSAEGTAELAGTSKLMQRLQVLIIAVIFALITAAVVRRIPPAEPPAAPAEEGSASPA